ncbi:hypothetical protein JZ751_006882 [Albula glossodonta]|uniref:Cadherin domain-containing protein n=1 Tax=Albula glossodonta TaxID=121402 RepID=A0A8T2P5M0_9TELE|nr:hypothetical protein JZ751_006882 [Albula glossodonta]
MQRDRKRFNGEIDYEKASHFQIDIEAKNHGGLSDSSKIIVDVIDVNDNSPIINIISMSRSIPEDSPPATVIAMVSVHDPDSASNGKVVCILNEKNPFAIISTSTDFYTLVTEVHLDRESNSEFNITDYNDNLTFYLVLSLAVVSFLFIVSIIIIVSVKCCRWRRDRLFYKSNGNLPVIPYYPPLYADVGGTGTLQHVYNYEVCRTTDSRKSNMKYVKPGTQSLVSLDSSGTETLTDVQEKWANRPINGESTSSYISVNAESGLIHAVRSFDYEQMKELKIRVKAQDGGSPPLSSNVTVTIIIRDQNDNTPQILYPVQPGSSLVAEIVPRSADIGYLVTKVVAVDVDSGQNAWLSFKLLKATDRALFEIGLQNGEIRTLRQVTDKDVVKQRLTVVVEDKGQPTRSATVNVNVVVANSFPEMLSESTNITYDKDYNDNLTFYLVLALAVVSLLFITSIISILSVKCYRWRRERLFHKSNGNLPVIPYYPPLYADVGVSGTLQHVYNYDTCRTTDSRKSDVKYVRPCSQSIISRDAIANQTLPQVQEKGTTDYSENQVSSGL